MLQRSFKSIKFDCTKIFQINQLQIFRKLFNKSNQNSYLVDKICFNFLERFNLNRSDIIFCNFRSNWFKGPIKEKKRNSTYFFMSSY